MTKLRVLTLDIVGWWLVYECQFWQKDTGHFFYLINFLSVSVQVYLVTLLDTDTKQAYSLSHSLRQIIDKQARAIYESGTRFYRDFSAKFTLLINGRRKVSCPTKNAFIYKSWTDFLRCSTNSSAFRNKNFGSFRSPTNSSSGVIFLERLQFPWYDVVCSSITLWCQRE